MTSLFSSIDTLRDRVLDDAALFGTAMERELIRSALDNFIEALTDQPDARSAMLALITRRIMTVADMPDSLRGLTGAIVGRSSPHADPDRDARQGAPYTTDEETPDEHGN